MHLVIVPRWAGSASDDFYPWLSDLAVRSLGLSVSAVELAPAPSAPEPAPTIANVRAAIAAPADTIVLAHSVGCRAAIAACRDLNEPLAGLVCVAGWFTLDDPWPSIMPWLAPELDCAPRAKILEAVISDDDPFTADHEATRARFEQLGGHVRVVPGARHFNGEEEFAVLEALRAVMG